MNSIVNYANITVHVYSIVIYYIYISITVFILLVTMRVDDIGHNNINSEINVNDYSIIQ